MLVESVVAGSVAVWRFREELCDLVKRCGRRK